MKKYRFVLIGLTLLLSFSPLLPPFATPVSAQIISISPTSGSVGTVVTISGSGFASSQWFTVKYAGKVVTWGVTSSAGSILGASFTVPAGADPGTNVVSVTSGIDDAFAYFEQVRGTIELSANEGTVGTKVTVNGEDFGRNVSIAILYDETVVGRTSTSLGIFSLSFTIPESSAGIHDIVAGPSEPDRSAPVEFNVRPSLADVTPSSGVANTIIAISGKGFLKNDNSIAVYLGTTRIGRVQSDELGTIANKSVTLGELPVGLWEVRATDSAGNTATTETKFTLKPAFAVVPTEGNVGRLVRVSGTGFLGRREISVSINGMEIETVNIIKSDRFGNFRGEFIMPEAKSGANMVIVSDGSNSGSATWTMEDDPPLVPDLHTPVNNKIIGTLGRETPSFAWSEVMDASGVFYDLQIAPDESFAFPVLAKEGLTTATYTLSEFEALERGLYYWRVRAVDGAGNTGLWVDAWKVQIGWPVPTWALVLPVTLATLLLLARVYQILDRRVARTQ